ncbi:MAG: hypothetical protein IPG63_18335 [Xanthomonadales bacterium]|nr:hypothetical protein [Xanthomonadales bacterium]
MPKWNAPSPSCRARPSATSMSNSCGSRFRRPSTAEARGDLVHRQRRRSRRQQIGHGAHLLDRIFRPRLRFAPTATAPSTGASSSIAAVSISTCCGFAPTPEF